MSIQILDDLDESVLKLIRDGLMKHAEAAGVGPRNHRPLNVLARGDGERMIGALVGATVWGWLEVNLLKLRDDG